MPSMRLARLLIATTAAAVPITGALASSSDRYVTDGATLRLVTTGLADEAGQLRGAVEIRLAPGWKTYWKEPGASGVPPQIDVAGSINVTAAALRFPAPEWHADDYGDWAGYGRPVVLPIVFTVGAPERFSVIEADFFLGICETICVPVQARLTVEPGSAPEDPADAAFVAAAFGGLPGTPDAGFGVREARLSGDVLLVKVSVPAAGSDRAALFLAPEAGYALGTPRSSGGDGTETTFEVPVLARPAGDAADVVVSYTLTAGDAAVTGNFTLP